MTGQAVTKGGRVKWGGGGINPRRGGDGGMEGQDGWRDKKADRHRAFRPWWERTAPLPLSSKPAERQGRHHPNYAVTGRTRR